MSRKKIVLIIVAVAVVFLGVAFIFSRDSETTETDISIVETTGETIPSKEYEEVEVVYEVDLSGPGGPFVPNAVYNYRLENPVETGTIVVIGYEQVDNAIVLHMDVNGQEVEYVFENTLVSPD